jgi:hypothetical protein
MPTLKGILSFPTLFQPKPVRDAQGNPTGVAKYSATLLLPPNDPQLPALQAEVVKWIRPKPTLSPPVGLQRLTCV